MKKISIVMCTYNGAKYLADQLDSIVNQTCSIYELIIQDDCSTDETVQIVKQYQSKYPCIKLFANEKNLGAYCNFMDALTKVTGEYIAISDQDDIWELSKIEKQMHYIKNHALCFSLSLSFGEGIPIDKEHRVPNFNIIRQLFYPVIPGHAMLFRKDILRHIPKEKSFAYDLLIAMAAELFGGIVVCPEVLNYHRRHLNAHSYITPGNYSHSVNNMFIYLLKGITLYFKNKEKIRTHFHQMHTLLNSFNPEKDDSYVKDALNFSDYMSKGYLYKASMICVRRKTDIFYTKEDIGLLTTIRAALFPLLCSHYYK